MKFTLLSIGILAGVATASIAAAQGYQPIVSVPFLDANAQNVEDYLNAAYWLSIVVGAFLAVIKIIIGGVKWMFSEGITSKTDARKDITGAIFGLLIILSAVLVLNTINTNLTCFKIFSEEGSNCDVVPEDDDGGGGPNPPGTPANPPYVIHEGDVYVPCDGLSEAACEARCENGEVISGAISDPGGHVITGHGGLSCVVVPDPVEISEYIIESVTQECEAQNGVATFDAETRLLTCTITARFSSSEALTLENDCLARGGDPFMSSPDASGYQTFYCEYDLSTAPPITSTTTDPVDDDVVECLGGIIEDDICYRDPKDINANVGDIFDPSLYPPTLRETARVDFGSSCASNGHVFASNTTCMASLVSGPVAVGDSVAVTGEPIELVRDALNRYTTRCPGVAEASEDERLVVCYANTNSVDANAGDVFDPTTYAPGDRNAAQTAFETSCEEKGFVYNATARLCDYPGSDYDTSAQLPFNHFCKPFDGNYRCDTDFTFCGNSNRCIYISDDGDGIGNIQLLTPDPSGSPDLDFIFTLGICGSNTNVTCSGGAQGSRFNDTRTVILLQNPSLLTGTNPMISGEGGADFQDMRNAIQQQFRSNCTASSGTLTDTVISTHPAFPGLTGMLACTPPTA